MSNTFKGVVKLITPPQTGETAKGKWVRQQVVIEEVKDKYPDSILIDCFNKQEEVDKLTVGAEVEAYYTTQAKEYNGRYFGSNNLWKFVVPTPVVPTPVAPEPIIPQSNDLPF